MGQRTETRSFISCDREGCKHEIEYGGDAERNWGTLVGGGRLSEIGDITSHWFCDDCANDLVAWLHGAHFAPLNGSREALSITDDELVEAALAGRVRWAIRGSGGQVDDATWRLDGHWAVGDDIRRLIASGRLLIASGGLFTAPAKSAAGTAALDQRGHALNRGGPARGEA